MPARVVGLALSGVMLLAAPAHADPASAPTSPSSAPAPHLPFFAPITAEPVPARTVELTTVVTIAPHAAPARVWVPVPLQSPVQKVIELSVQAPAEWTIEREPTHGNRFLYTELPAADAPVRVRWTAVVKRYEWFRPEREHTTPAQLAQYTRALPLVPVGGPVLGPRAKVILARGNGHTEARARQMFDYVRAEMAYDKSGEGWGRGDAVYACEVGKGNCTDFHAMFNGLARTAGIPARLTMGLALPDAAAGTIGGYHCWTAYWLDGHGWVPMDISESDQHPDRPVAEYFARLDQHRIAMTRGRELVLAPPQAGPRLNYAWESYVEIKGAPAAVAETTRTYRNLSKADLIFRTAVR